MTEQWFETRSGFKIHVFPLYLVAFKLFKVLSKTLFSHFQIYHLPYITLKSIFKKFSRPLMCLACPVRYSAAESSWSFVAVQQNVPVGNKMSLNWNANQSTTSSVDKVLLWKKTVNWTKQCIQWHNWFHSLKSSLFHCQLIIVCWPVLFWSLCFGRK